MEVDDNIGADRTRHGQALGDAVDGDHRRDAHQLRAGARAQPDWALSEDRNGVAEADAAAFGTREAGGHDVRAH